MDLLVEENSINHVNIFKQTREIKVLPESLKMDTMCDILNMCNVYSTS